MDPDRWTDLKDDLDRLLDLPAESRRAALADVDAGRRDALAALLDAHDRAGGFLDVPAAPLGVGALAVPDEADPLVGRDVGRDVGPYRVVRPVGHGGMGDVYLAERSDGLFAQRVALKVVRAGGDSASVLRRFADERRILGRLRHAGIARPLDAGALPDGRPWIAMDYVEGRPLTEAAAGLPVAERVRLVAETAAIVHAAHQALVVHRDLKPSNVLVSEGDDGRLHPTLLDFGIAKVLDPETGGVETETGLRPMTRAYAAPEQVRGEPATTATDVHALGVLLYEVLTGRLPFGGPTPAAVETAILTAEPAPPSRTTGGGTAAPARDLRGDLDTICLKALAKRPADRYGSAEAFEADLRRVLDGRPILARPPSLAYRARKFVRRHRAGVAVAALALVALVGGVATYTVRVRAERDRAERAAERAERTADFLASLFDSSDPNGTSPDSLTARDLLDAGAAQAREDLAGEPVVLAQMLTTMGRAYLALGLYDRAGPALEDAVALLDSTGEDPLGLRDALLEMSNLRFRTEDYAAAAGAARRALALDSVHAAPGESERLAILNTVALVHTETGDQEAAVRVLREVVAGRRRLTGEDDRVDLAGNLNNLGLILARLGRADEAAPLLDESVALVEELRGADHPYVAFALNSRVGVHLQRGDTVRALADQRRAVAIGEAALGPDHPFTAHARGLLAGLLAGRVEESR
ncbi:MAG TPA: serine/threonine-protein kinase [Rubricoccaceae bacterium]